MNTDCSSAQHPDSLVRGTPITEIELLYEDRYSVMVEFVNQARPGEPEDPRLTIWSFITDEELANHPASRETAKALEELYDSQEGLTIDEMREEARKIFQENGTDGSQGAPAWRAPEDVDEIIASFIDYDNFDERSLYFIAHAADGAAGIEDGGIGGEPGPDGGDGRMDLT